MSENEAAPSSPDHLEFRFRWDKSEHRRFYRIVQLDGRRGSKIRWLLNLWFGFVALVGLRALVPDSNGAEIGSGLVPLVIVGGWFAFDRWGLAYLSARSYEREHARCIPHDQVRVLDIEGITAQCTISSASVRWAGISKVRETDEFFLFFTTPSCAIQLPKRAIKDLAELRGWLARAAQGEGPANMRTEPTRR